MDITQMLTAAASGSGSQPGLTWTKQNTKTNGFTSIAVSGAGLCVAVGANVGAVSTDGVNWTAYANATNDYFYKVIWDGYKFIAVGYNTGTNIPFIKTSTNGYTWTTQSLPSGVTTGQLRDVGGTYGNLIAIGPIGKVLISADGVTWTANAAPSANGLTCTWNSNAALYLIAGSYGLNKVYTSPDGVTWTLRTCGSGSGSSALLSGYASAFVSASNYFILVGATNSLANNAFISPDGITWSLAPFVATLNAWTLMTYGGTAYMNTTNNSLNYWGTTSFYGSVNGWPIDPAYGSSITNFSSGAFAYSLTSNKVIVASSSQLYIMNMAPTIVGSPQLPGYVDNSYFSSGLGLDTVTSLAANSTVMLAGGTPANYLTVGTGGPVANKTVAYKTTDGLNWVPLFSQNNTSATSAYTFAYVGGLFFSLPTSSDLVQRSPDATTWTSLFTVTGAKVAYGGSTYVVASSTNAYYSTNGTTWTLSATYSFSYTLASLVWDGTYFTAFATNGANVYRSPDGITWTSLTSFGLPSTVNSVVYKAGLYVAGGAETGSGTGYNIYTSTDGITWTTRQTPALKSSVYQVYTDGFNFYASVDGTGGVYGVISSSDGISWFTRTSESVSGSVIGKQPYYAITTFKSKLYCYGFQAASVVS